MHEKKIAVIVDAITAGAQQKLRGVGKDMRDLERGAAQASKGTADATAQVGQSIFSLENIAKVALPIIGSYYTKMAIEAAVSAAKAAAVNIDIQNSFEALADRQGLASREIVEALKRASKGTVDEYSLMLEANKALRLGVATTVEEFEALMKIAMVRAKEFGISTRDAWQYIVTGIGRASPLILDNLGILLDANATYEEHARLLGKTADGLTKLEEKEAIRNRILREGAADLERWNEMGETATDVFAQQEAASAELRQELGEALLPVVIELTKGLRDLAHFAAEGQTAWEEHEDVVMRTARSYDELYLRMSKVAELEGGGRWAREGTKYREQEIVTTEGARLANERLKDSYADIDLKMRDVAQTKADIAAATGDERDSIEDLSDTVTKAAAVWEDYFRDVAEKNWQFARQMEDAQFRAGQAAQNAGFRRYEIERDAGDRLGDLQRSGLIRYEAELAQHQSRLRYMQQDLLDDLADMEWDYQRERSDIMRKAPWWIRNVLTAEFAERERIAASGDKDALRNFDQSLKERIRQIDPVYADELDRLEEQYEHKKDIETREGRQAQDRQKEGWRIQQREQRQSLREQERQIERSLRNQLDAWQFHEDQRLESERWSMERMQLEHGHALSVMYETTRNRLADITPLYKHYGEEHARAYLEALKIAWASAAPGGFSPIGGPGIPVAWNVPFPIRAQRGLEYVPRTMLLQAHKGEAVLPPAEAEIYRARGSAPIEIILQFYGGYTPYQGQQVAREVSRELGPMIQRRGR